MRNFTPLSSVESPATLRVEKRANLIRLVAAGEWISAEATRMNHELLAIDVHGMRTAEIDASGVTALDSTGALLLLRTKNTFEHAGLKVTSFVVPERYSSLVSAIEADHLFDELQPYATHHSLIDIVERTGRGTVHVLKEGYDLLGFLGRVAIETMEAILSPRRELPFPALVHQVQETGLTAIPIVCLLNFLLGIVVAYQGAIQLKKFGAQIFTIDLLGVVILRELGILITAIIVAGRSGSAFTAQIGTMRVNEEIDAMQTLGINVTEVLVVPRVLGLVIALPVLTLFADFVGVIGGMVMTYFDLGISIPAFIRELQSAISVNTLLVGLIKAPVFAFIIGLVGCFEGLRVERNAASVGLLTTRSVVESIFLVIACDAGFSIFFSVIGI